MRKFIIIYMLIGLFGCTKDLNIADFTDDFSFYQSELKIEAILNSTNFMESVVRVDKTILITDTTLFNGIDDNGDWVSYIDENDNGQWDEGEALNDDIGGDDGGRGNGKPDKGEPHVDDYTEILPYVHDSTMTSVILVEKSLGKLIAEFEWISVAGNIEDYYREDDDESKPIEVFTYGGYKPAVHYSDVQIEFGKEYEFQITTKDGDVITGSTVPFSPAELILEDTNWDADTLLLNSDQDLVNFLTDDDVSFGNFTFKELVNPDSLVFVYSSFFPPNESDFPGQSIYTLSRGFFPIGLSQLTLTIFNKDYSQYLISSLPLRDEALSNLRDQNGNVILGIAGSIAVTEILVNNQF